MPSSEILFPWLIHSAVVSLVVLVIGAAAVLASRQPVRRVRIIEVTLAGCLIAPWLGMMPGYPRLGIARREASSHNAVGRREGNSPVFAAQASIGEAASSAPRESRQPPVHAQETPDPSLDVAALLVAVYGLGVFLGLAWWLVGVVGLARIVSTSRPAPARCREVLAELAGGRAPRVRLLVNGRLRQPFASAWGRPVIVLPERLCGDERALRCALAHEWTHVERHDFRAWTLAGMARVLFFYQPLVWWLRRQLRLGQDFLADAQAARHAPQPEDYAEFLTAWAATASSRPAPVGLGMVLSRSELYRRVVMLVENPTMESRAPRLWTLSAVSAAVLLVAAVAAFSLAPTAAAEEKPSASDKLAGAEGEQKPSSVVSEQAKPAPRQIRLQYRYKPWDEVLGDVGRQAGLTLKADALPPGTVNLTGSRSYAADEAIDILNSALISKGFTLRHEGQTLRLVRSGDKAKQASQNGKGAAGTPGLGQEAEKKYVPLVTLECSGVSGGFGSLAHVTGFTFVKLSDPKDDETRLAVSFASDQPSDDSTKYRVVAIDKQRRVIANEPQGVSGWGRKLGVITILCGFPIAEKDLDRIMIERLKD